MDTKLNTALVGFRIFGKKYYKNILNNKKFKLNVIFRKNNFSNKIYQKLSNKNIKSNKIDAAIIVSPVETHYKISKIFIEKKIPLILEKPAAKNPSEIKKLISLSEKKRTSVIVNYSDLFNENFNFLISKKKLIGKIKFIEASFGKYSEEYKNYSQQPSQDWLSHPLSLILKVFKKLSSFRVISNNTIKKKKSFFQTIEIKFKTVQKIEGKISFSNQLTKKKRRLVIYGEKGLINYDGYNDKNNFVLTKKKIIPIKKRLSPMENVLETLYLKTKKKIFYSNLKLSLEIGKILQRLRKK